MCKDGRVSHERNSVLIVQKIRMITGNNNILLQFITSIFIFKHEKSGSVFIWFYKKVINLRKTGRAHLSLSLSLSLRWESCHLPSCGFLCNHGDTQTKN